MDSDTGVETLEKPTASEENGSPEVVDKIIARHLDDYGALIDIEDREERDRRREELDGRLVEELSEVATGGREEAQQLVKSRVRSAVTIYSGLLSSAQNLEHTDKAKHQDVVDKIEKMKCGEFPIEEAPSPMPREELPKAD